MASSRRAFGEGLAKQARQMGWPVANHKDGGWVITTPKGRKIQVHWTPSDVNADNHVMQELERDGWIEAKEEYNRLSEDKRAERLKAVHEANIKRLDLAQQQADALAKAAGQSRVPEIVLLTPSPFPKTFERVLVTPELASKLLDLNTGNRPIRRGDVELWKGVIERGEFRYTHQGVAVDNNGVLQDGQHRLTGVFESGVPVEMQVSIGMPSENFNAIDNGLRRNFRDVAHKLGLGSPGKVGSAARLLIILEDYPKRSFSDKVSNTEVANFLSTPYGEEGVPTVGDAVQLAVNESQMQWVAYRINSSAAAVAVYLLWQIFGREDPLVTEFLEGLKRGSDLPGEDARLALRRTILSPSSKHNRSAYHHLGLLIKAWGKFARNENVKVLSFRSKVEDLPKLYVPGTK